MPEVGSDADQDAYKSICVCHALLCFHLFSFFKTLFDFSIEFNNPSKTSKGTLYIILNYLRLTSILNKKGEKRFSIIKLNNTKRRKINKIKKT
mgnify:CR=1 FL=1